ncbi:MAG: esterase [Verrucomicrobiae bacterium]|nr:esterase [Verrucomicrobiae bacterium]
MPIKTTIISTLIFLGCQLATWADEPVQLNLEVDGISRLASVYAPASAHTNPAPVVFVFHGHGGNARQVQRQFHLEREWPEAIVVYPQGLPTPGQLTDPEGRRNGWQATADAFEGRDLKFFDALLARLRKDYRVADQRIYATGHSNGGGFTYLLWLERGATLRAVAPCAAVAKYAPRLSPKPMLMVAGQKDPLVKFSWQERMLKEVQRVNGCSTNGETWGQDGVIYPSTLGTPVIAFIHPGGHVFPQAAPGLIAKFFKEH